MRKFFLVGQVIVGVFLTFFALSNVVRSIISGDTFPLFAFSFLSPMVLGYLFSSIKELCDGDN